MLSFLKVVSNKYTTLKNILYLSKPGFNIFDFPFCYINGLFYDENWTL